MEPEGLSKLNLTQEEERTIAALGVRSLDELAGMIAAAPEAALAALGDALVQRVRTLRPSTGPHPSKSQFRLGARLPNEESGESKR